MVGTTPTRKGEGEDDGVRQRLWRPPDVPRLLRMHSVVDNYGSETNGEYAIGLIRRRGLAVRRERHELRPGDLGVWDLSGAQAGAPLDGGPWECNLMVLEQTDLDGAVRDPVESPFDLEFPQPVVRDAGLATRFLKLHENMERPASTLERQGMLVIGEPDGGGGVSKIAARGQWLDSAGPRAGCRRSVGSLHGTALP